MAFSIKDWKNSPDTSTPLSGTAIEDLEERLSDYSDSVAAGGIELGYAQITADATSTANTGSETDVAGLSTTVTVGSRPIVITFSSRSVSNTNASEFAIVYIKESTTVLSDALTMSTAANANYAMERSVRLTPSAGSHTYKIALSRFGAGTAKIAATATGPAFIQVVEV